MLYNIKYVMLSYVMTSKLYFNAIVKIPFYFLWVRNIKHVYNMCHVKLYNIYDVML